MKCEYCGRRVPGRLVLQGAEFCRGCGAPLPDEDDKRIDHDKSYLKGLYDAEIHQIVNGNHPTISRGDIQSIVKLKRRYQSQGLEVY